jgi:hypothetical protein
MQNVNEKQLTVTLHEGSLRVSIICLEIIDFLRRNNYCVTRAWLKKHIGGNNEYKTIALNHLISIGVVYRGGTGTARDRYSYSLTKEWDAIWHYEEQKTRSHNRH